MKAMGSLTPFPLSRRQCLPSDPNGPHSDMNTNVSSEGTACSLHFLANIAGADLWGLCSPYLESVLPEQGSTSISISRD